MEAVISAFSLYFQLVNLAEARGRVRALRRRERSARDGLLDDSIAEAIARLRRAGRDDAALDDDPRPAAHHAGAHRASDGGPPTDGADRAAPLRGAARAARRPAAHPVGGPRGPPPAARGDHAPVADLRPALRGARSRSTRCARRWPCSTRRCSRSCRGCTARPTRPWTGPVRRGPRTGTPAAARAGVPALRVVDRRRPRRQPGRDGRDDRADAAHPGRSRPPRLRGGGDAPDADGVGGHGRRARVARPWPTAWPAMPRPCPRPTGSSAAASPTSPTASASGSSPSGCAGPA